MVFVLLAFGMGLVGHGAAQDCSVREYIYAGSRLVATEVKATPSVTTIGFDSVGPVVQEAMAEAEGGVTLSVSVAGDCVPYPLTVSYTVDQLTGQPGVFETPSPSPLVFTAGESTKTLTIPVVNDCIRTATGHSLRIRLTAPNGATLVSAPGSTLPAGEAVVTVEDDDFFLVGFTAPTASYREAGGAISPSRVSFGGMKDTSCGNGGKRSVRVMPGNGSAEVGRDFCLLAPDTQCVPFLDLSSAGRGIVEVPVRIIDDGIIETGSNFQLSLGALGRALSKDLVLELAEQTVTIEDDDTTMAPARFHRLNACRIRDTRNNSTPLAANELRQVQVAGLCGVPGSGATAVVVSVVAVNPTAAGHFAVASSEISEFETSLLNFEPGKAVAGNGHVILGPSGKVGIRNGSAGTTDLVLDVLGYFQ